MTPLYTWAGRYCAFIRNGWIFDRHSHYLGWLTEDGKAWERDGSFLGELVDENYILRRTAMAIPARRAVRPSPARPATPAARVNRAGRVSRAGRIDALEELLS
ncbi:4-fold beta flower protein [Tropicimonas omnivorans]|uniref:4-fold beta flower protein n=1 Tax=Tropicimonas omnivorans TaxID=3075590 RepID=UPI003D76EDF7